MFIATIFMYFSLSYLDSNRNINIFFKYLAGDIAEVAIRQGVTRNSITVGAQGDWNSTTARRHYFLVRNENFEMTDAEIRGGLDGLILSELGKSYVLTFPEFKLSQLIDMYYSHVSIFFALLKQKKCCLMFACP